MIEVLQIITVLFASFSIGMLFEALGCPALIGEIIVGIALGPHSLNIVPHSESVVTAGQIGLLLLVLEGGLHIELSTLRRVGVRAFCIAISGTTLPVLLSWTLLPVFPHFKRMDGLVAGTSLSSTAIGMAASLMKDLDLLSTHLGQLICCAAMVDDVASLVLLAMISGASGMKSHEEHIVTWGPQEGIGAVLLPLFTSVTFMLFSGCFASVMPRAISIMRGFSVFSRLSNAHWSNTLLGLMLSYATLLTVLAVLGRTTFLLGAFMGGVGFSSIPEALDAFDGSVPPVSAWTSRVFFVSIGMAVPLGTLFETQALLFGLLLTCIAVISKVVTGIFDWHNKCTIGWAMVGRGELGFVMAEQGYRTNLTSKLTFSVTVWALLLSTLASPIVLRRILHHWPASRAACKDNCGDDHTGPEREVHVATSETVTDKRTIQL